MARRWKARSTTPGERRWTAAAVALLAVDGGDGVYPAAADVWHTADPYGPTGADYTPAMVGSDIANLEAGNVRSGVVIDDVTGTYDGPESVAATGILDAGFEALLARFGETVVYVPNGGAERPITALVRRSSAFAVPPTNAYTGPAITVTVRNNATSGIAATEINAGLDNIKVGQRPGQTQQSRPVGRVLQSTDVLTQLEVR